MTREKRTNEGILSLIRTSLDAATRHPGLVKASVYQSEGYLRGLQGLPWEAPVAVRPAAEDAAGAFLHDVRAGAVALRGRIKKGTAECLEAFRSGMSESFPDSENKAFAQALFRLWVRWLAGVAEIPFEHDPASFSRAAGRRVGELLKEEYQEGAAGHLAEFLLDKRLHLGSVRPYLQMRGWLLGTIEHLRRSGDAGDRERAEILDSNMSSIVLRALHNAGPGYAAEAVNALPSMIKDLDAAIRNLSGTEIEAAQFLRNNRSTILTKALHSGSLGYGSRVSQDLPAALKDFDSRIGRLETSAPETARVLRSNKRTVVYRALTNGRLDALKSR